jgi:hypothetical protein
MTFPVFASGDVLNASDMNAVGLWLVKTQTIGSAVSSVQVTSAFSADYDAYKIVVSGGTASANSDMRLTLGASTASYYYGGFIHTFGGTTINIAGNNVAFWLGGVNSAQSLSLNVDLINPFAAKETAYWAPLAYTHTGGAGGIVGGYHASAVSYTSFTITPSTGTLTGGTIRVYGYRN